MPEIKGPAVSPEAFRVEGHCCGIRLPALKDLTGKGIEFELSPETKAELIAQGMLPSADPRADEEEREVRRILQDAIAADGEVT